jgi:hypothetical protein
MLAAVTGQFFFSNYGTTNLMNRPPAQQIMLLSFRFSEGLSLTEGAGAVSRVSLTCLHKG